ncbi:MAG: hypothetical protein JRD89_13235 [Deltaproteobacteria bacterium]|nr:hypothetical protein [Deltaproteobacteria bacterium]
MAEMKLKRIENGFLVEYQHALEHGVRYFPTISELLKFVANKTREWEWR